MSPLVAFIIGYGPRVGASVATHLKAQGYKVAVGSRKADQSAAEAQGFLAVQVDAGKFDSIEQAFKTVNQKLGAPNVVVFNAASLHPVPNVSDPLTLPLDHFKADANLGLNTFGIAQLALPGFRSAVHKDHPKALIVTGNPLPYVAPLFPRFTGSAVQKEIEAHIVQSLANVYGPQGIRFYFASEVGEGGGVPKGYAINGDAHAKAYWNLINQKEQGNWDHRFTADGNILEDYTIDLKRIDELFPGAR